VTTAEETTQDTPTTNFKRCFSGSGKFANRKWAPGGDATYLSRLRKAHLADETLPDPWYIQEHGGIEADNVPEDGWPQLSAMDIAQRLDQERGAGVESHWAATLDAAKEKAQQKDAAKSERQKLAAATKAQRDEERARQAKRPKKGSIVRFTTGDNEGREAEVLEQAAREGNAAGQRGHERGLGAEQPERVRTKEHHRQGREPQVEDDQIGDEAAAQRHTAIPYFPKRR